jgi:hypothetical protein
MILPCLEWWQAPFCGDVLSPQRQRIFVSSWCIMHIVFAIPAQSVLFLHSFPETVQIKNHTLNNAFTNVQTLVSDVTTILDTWSVCAWVKTEQCDLEVSVLSTLSWETNSHLASQEIFLFSWNQKVHYHVYETLPLVHIISQTNQIHILEPSSFEVCFIISCFQ